MDENELISQIDLEDPAEVEEAGLDGLEGIDLAVISAIGADGVKITVDGEEESGDKYYKVNSGILFSVGDRVKIHKNSGTYIVEYAVGSPMSRYPIPSGGSDGQMLVKDGETAYKVKWATPSTHGIPAGGSSGQVLAKSSNADYSVGWTDQAHGIPTGGSTGQVLTKSNNTNYSVQWSDYHGIPSGGTNGQVLLKDGSTSYSVKWGSAPAVSALTSGSYTVTFNGSALYPSTNCTLGSNSYYFNGCYLKGAMRLGNSAYDSTLGFFGTTPQSRQSVSNSATVATLITALKAYGLIN